MASSRGTSVSAQSVTFSTRHPQRVSGYGPGAVLGLEAHDAVDRPPLAHDPAGGAELLDLAAGGEA